MKYSLLIAAVLSAQLALAENITRQTPADPDGDVEIVNISGDVRVVGWDRALVQLDAELGAGAESLEFTSQDDKVLIRVKRPPEEQNVANSLVVRVPKASTVIVKTVSASQQIQEVTGDQRLQSVSGDIQTQLGAGDFEAKPVSGRIRAVGREVPGTARVTSVSGAIDLDKVAGEIELVTVNGSIDLRGHAVERARLKATNGAIRFEAGLLPDGRVDLETINGEVRSVLKGPVDATFDVETFNGSINSCFGPKPQRVSQYAPGNALRFSEGGGRGRVRIKTLNGSVNLCRE